MLYLELGSVHALQRELTEHGIVSKQRVTAFGTTIDGLPLAAVPCSTCCAARSILARIQQKDIVHEGSHEAIVPQQLFGEVQQRLDSQARRHRAASEKRTAKALLTGRLFDASAGHRR